MIWRSCSSIFPSVCPIAVSCRISLSVMLAASPAERRGNRARQLLQQEEGGLQHAAEEEEQRRDGQRHADVVVRRDPHGHQLAEDEDQERRPQEHARRHAQRHAVALPGQIGQVRSHARRGDVGQGIAQTEEDDDPLGALTQPLERRAATVPLVRQRADAGLAQGEEGQLGRREERREDQGDEKRDYRREHSLLGGSSRPSPRLRSTSMRD